MIGVVVCVCKRTQFLVDCLRSMVCPDVHVLVCSVPSAKKDTTSLAWQCYRDGLCHELLFPIGTMSGYETFYQGANYLVGHMSLDLLMLTADDYVMRYGWAAKAERFFADATDISHATLELEPSFPWNKEHEIVERHGIKGLIRDTLPGANWIMTDTSWKQMRPAYKELMQDPTLDHKLNRRRREEGYKLAALNLAEHVGAKASCVGNSAFLTDAKPLDAKWQITN